MTTRHSFLFVPAHWSVSGYYYDEDDREYPVKGETCILHEKGMWRNNTSMTISPKTPGRQIINNYRIEPFGGKKKLTEWHSDTPDLGKMSGRMIIVDDAIFSHFETDDGCCYGSEVLIRIDQDRYLNRGYLMSSDSRSRSWVVELTRIAQQQ